jgi:integrase
MTWPRCGGWSRCAGCARGEVTGLCWRHLDVPGHIIHIQEQVIYLGARRIGGPPKSACGQRGLPLDDVLLTMLAEHREQQRARHGEAVIAAGRPIFTLGSGRPVRPDWVTRRFARLIADRGLPPIRFHDLRRATATLGVTGGVPLRVMQYILGHADVATTADVYTVVPGHAGRDAMAAIAALAGCRDDRPVLRAVGGSATSRSRTPRTPTPSTAITSQVT